MADDEIARIKHLYDAKRARLHIIEQQIAQFGEKWAPAHLLTERAELNEAIAKYETVLGSAIPTEVGDDLGTGGRFVLLLEEIRRVGQTSVLHGVQLSEHIADTAAYRAQHKAEHDRDRRLRIIAFVVIALFVAFLLGRLLA